MWSQKLTAIDSTQALLSFRNVDLNISHFPFGCKLKPHTSMLRHTIVHVQWACASSMLVGNPGVWPQLLLFLSVMVNTERQTKEEMPKSSTLCAVRIQWLWLGHAVHHRFIAGFCSVIYCFRFVVVFSEQMSRYSLTNKAHCIGQHRLLDQLTIDDADDDDGGDGRL